MAISTARTATIRATPSASSGWRLASPRPQRDPATAEASSGRRTTSPGWRRSMQAPWRRAGGDQHRQGVTIRARPTGEGATEFFPIFSRQAAPCAATPASASASSAAPSFQSVTPCHTLSHLRGAPYRRGCDGLFPIFLSLSEPVTPVTPVTPNLGWSRRLQKIPVTP